MANTITTIRFKSVMAGSKQSRKRAKTSSYIREHIARFSNSDPDTIRIDGLLNQYLTRNSAKNGDLVKVEIIKGAGIVSVKLAPEMAQKFAPPPAAPKQPAPQAKAIWGKTEAKPAQDAKKPAEAKPQPKEKKEKPKQEKKPEPAKAEGAKQPG